MPEAAAEKSAPQSEGPSTAGSAAKNPALVYVRNLWRGELPLARVFWTDMILIGSLVNMLATIAALILFVSGAPVALGVIAHFAPVPYNLLLLFAVWQASSREATQWSFAAQVAAVLWFATAFVI